ncbi:PQQ-dependent sugar dehydrogenase [Pseudohalioglobus sediminis]|uniref:PQQ-dependent sugar dehydrogenase n=1 Tax=Pseudohalioglobus sediminis TaxID=2606449 RepID=A0A5B0WXZ8_9GAMM|nr:PQQ-dependent sugar dehydrogenase [Pseudohalioglobus sediminis]KAA1191954.1 PQQ-dependent sugar dehydrogenase [Pseudohalioglobus sediminis]
MSIRNLALIALLAVTINARAQESLPFNVEPIVDFDEPWAITFLPDGRMLVTEKKGVLNIVTREGEKTRVEGVPDVDYGGQGGLGDVVLHPDFGDNGSVYLSYVEAGIGDTRGAAVARGTLDLSGDRPTLSDVQVLWRQYPKMLGYGHYGHRLVVDDDGYLWISSGDRQKFTPAQDMQSNVGKVLRLKDDGTIPGDNPFADYFSKDPLVDDVGVYPEIWSLGHRNPLGMDLDLDGQLWVLEMGPLHGDELNLIRRGGNYGYPEVSDGDHYDRREIPDHSTRPEFLAPAISWVPAISPGDLTFLQGKLFRAWRGNALAAALGEQAIVRIEVDGESAREVERYAMGARIRAIAEGPEGAIWVLEDERRNSQGRLLKLTPKP